MVRDVQLGGHDSRYKLRNGVKAFALYPTFANNLLRTNEFLSIMAGIIVVGHVIKRMFVWSGIEPLKTDK